jgi:hypothetical protein
MSAWLEGLKAKPGCGAQLRTACLLIEYPFLANKVHLLSKKGGAIDPFFSCSGLPPFFLWNALLGVAALRWCAAVSWNAHAHETNGHFFFGVPGYQMIEAQWVKKMACVERMRCT